MNGIIVMDKPSGFTSFDIVAIMRGLCRTKKIGHTGTLDPMATGVLPLLLGSATRAASLLPDTGKEYEAGFRLGYSTDTQDSTGKTTAESSLHVTREDVENVLPRFRGEIFQLPPMYSAVSVGGKRLYQLARQGIEVEREKRRITIYRMELTSFDEPSQSGTLTVACSKGTYIRTLCADIGLALGTYGVMTALRRTQAAGFSLDDAVTLDKAKELAGAGELEQRLLPTQTLFTSYPALQVSQAQARRFSNGGALNLSYTALKNMQPENGGIYRVNSPENVFLGLGVIGKEEICVLRLFKQ